MELIVLKGYRREEIIKMELKPLYENDLNEKINILNYDNMYYQNLLRSLMMIKDNRYILYEEFVFMCINDNGATLKNILSTFNIKLKIIYNNIYPEIYPCEFTNTELLDDFIVNNEMSLKEPNNDIIKLSKIYNKVYYIANSYYVSYNNMEYDMVNIEREYKYDFTPKKLQVNLKTEIIYEINEDKQQYIEKINEIIDNNYTNIGIKLMGESEIVLDLYKSFCAFINTSDSYLITDYEKYGYREDLTDEFKNIVLNILKVPRFKSFRDLEFYENPNLSNKMIKINQTQIMADMVEQVKKSKECEKIVINSNGKKLSGYRDIFVTAPTGSGKSLIFQVPAIYLAEKYGLLTIIITPLIELMNDQVRNLHERGYLAAERLNSSINPIEKKNIVKNISEGKINLLYLAPETLLSYSIDQLIGDRKIGMVIVDEAHIVSTWGKGFRPDYWYLGSYLNKLRKVRNSKGLKDKNKIVYCFPICTFTATAVNGGKYDDVNDIKSSLNLRDTITYFGKVIRDDIKFDIKDYSNEKTANQDAYIEMKNCTFKQKLDEYIRKDEKTIVYFPYANTAYDAYRANSAKGFGELKDIKQYFSIYTGGGKLSNESKNINMLEFRDNIKKIMFATKAFGMGIDIKDIQNVYHYAASGNLNDYVQEVGRVARSEDILYGVASCDYYDRDLNYMKTLYGMSALHNYQIQKILNIIINIYDSKKKYNLMVTPDMFRPAFSKCDEDQLENKIKSALLTIEMDLANRYKGSKPIVTRARNMFTECFAMVDKNQENNLLNSKYGKYFQKIASGRTKQLDLKYRDQVFITDPGDIFLINLKDLWEEQHYKKTFGEFKYELNNNKNVIFEQFGPFIKLRNKITIKTIDGSPLSELKERILNEINIVSDVLNELQIEGSFFSKDDFAAKLEPKYNNRFKSKIVANSYLDMISEYRDTFVSTFFETRTINDEIKYRITKGNFRSVAEKTVNISPLLKSIRYSNSDEFTTYDAVINKKINERDNRYDAINIALLFGLVSFEILGGNKPEIFIRINYPEKIRHIVEGKVYYNNYLIEQAKNRHKNDIVILNYFFTKLKTDDERWHFIENYYLGKITSNELGELMISE